ncbi:MAG TPA: DUF3793 family protein [Candidatus Borkfalkia stercoripullorum]|nr:DUF3793 family protein [Candidatus Borkfalkia stercoripullorum]
MEANKLEISLASLCGAAMAGIKPSSLAVCGEESGEALAAYAHMFARKGISILPLCKKRGKITYLVYRESKLRAHLCAEDSAAFLAAYGYPVGNFEGCIARLKLRLSGRRYPHEIGVFLGYPPEDVSGYLNDPYGCIFSGMWKVYAEPEKKRALFERYRRCQSCILRRLASGQSLAEIFI